MGEGRKTMTLAELDARHKAIEQDIRKLAADSGLTPEQVAAGVTRRVTRRTARK